MGLGLDLGGAKLDVGAAQAQNNLVELQEFPIKASHWIPEVATALPMVKAMKLLLKII